MEFASATDGEEDNIWVACSDGNISRVQALLRAGHDVNGKDENGYTPIHAAVSYGHLELIEFLIAAGADPNCRDVDGDCPLHVCEDPAVAEYLLSRGADETAVNSEGLSVYEQSVELENEEMMMFWAKRFGFELVVTNEEHHDLQAVAEEEEADDEAMAIDVSASAQPMVFPPGTVITPGEPLPPQQVPNKHP